MFEGHGTIIEVVLLKDKRTGARQGINIEYYLYYQQFVQFGFPRVARRYE